MWLSKLVVMRSRPLTPDVRQRVDPCRCISLIIQQCRRGIRGAVPLSAEHNWCAQCREAQVEGGVGVGVGVTGAACVDSRSSGIGAAPASSEAAAGETIRGEEHVVGVDEYNQCVWREVFEVGSKPRHLRAESGWRGGLGVGVCG